MPTRNIVLTEQQARFLEELVESGKYQNASEVLREGLRLVQRRDSEDRLRLELLREAIQNGLEEFESGKFTRFDTEEELDTYLNRLTSEVLPNK